MTCSILTDKIFPSQTIKYSLCLFLFAPYTKSVLLRSELSEIENDKGDETNASYFESISCSFLEIEQSFRKKLKRQKKKKRTRNN